MKVVLIYIAICFLIGMLLAWIAAGNLHILMYG
jgi:hypothetical protein